MSEPKMTLAAEFEASNAEQARIRGKAMKCAICNEETIGTNAKMWGCDFAHVTCIKAYSLGTNDARSAAQAAQPEAVGWKRVPVEPTPAMLVAMWDHRESMRGQSENRIARAGYAAMLTVAPTTTESQPAEADERSEREAFEAWMRSIGKTDRDLQCDGWNNTGEYSWITERSMWQAWQARALSAPTAPAQAEPRKPDDVDLLLRAVFELCEATEEAPEVEPKNEHQRGFDKGRRFEAKAIRRSVGDWFQATFCGQSFMGEPVFATPPSAATPEPSDAEGLSSEQIEAGAKELSKCMDYPWDHMPHTGRSHMRETVKAINAAIRATKGGEI